MESMFKLLHNASLIANVERTLNDFMDKGVTLYVKNPDGTLLRLQPGMQIISMEMSSSVSDENLQEDLNEPS